MIGSQLSIKEIADCYVVHTNRCFNKKFSLLKHLALIMLHDYLHCLVFKEQSVLSLSALASSDSFILSHSDWLVKNFFEVFFEAFRYSSVPRQSRLRYTVSYPCLSATCIILHESEAPVNTFFEKNMKKRWQIAVCRGVRDKGILFIHCQGRTGSNFSVFR